MKKMDIKLPAKFGSWPGWKKMTAYLVGAALCLVCIVGLTSYFVTGSVLPGAFFRLCTYEVGEYTELVFEQPEDITRVSYGYRPDGTVNTLLLESQMEDINQEVVLVTLVPNTEMAKNDYDGELYLVNEGAATKACNVEFTYVGQDKITQCVDIPKTAAICIRFNLQADFENLAADKHPFMFQKMIINDSREILRLQSGIIVKGAAATALVLLLAVALVLCIRFHAAERVLRVEEKIGMTAPRKFLVWGAVLGLVFLTALPLFQAPDEGAHMEMIGRELGYENLGHAMYDAIGEQTDSGRVMSHTGEKLSIANYLDAVHQPYQEQLQRVGPPSVQILRHLPQAIGIQLSLLLGVSPFGTLMIGRLSGLLFYMGLGYLSVKLIPHRKSLLMLYMVCPMMIQQAVSLSYDCVLLALSMLFISCVLHLRAEVHDCGWRQVALLIVMLVPIALIKLNYTVLVFLVLIIPFDRWKLKLGKLTVDQNTVLAHRVAVILVLSCLVVAGAVLLANISIGKVLYAFLLNPMQSISLLVRTLWEKKYFYFISSLGVFGWLDTYVGPLYCLAIAGLLIVTAMTMKKGKTDTAPLDFQFHLGEGIGVFATFFLCGGLCFVGMFGWSLLLLNVPLGATIAEISGQISMVKLIEGVQGRYVLPILILPLLLLRPCRQLTEARVNLIRIAGQTAITAATVAALVTRYWVM